MKRTVVFMLGLLLALSLSACGGGTKGRADEALAGKYVIVTGTAMGMTISGEDMGGFTLELKSGGKASMNVGGTSADGKWINDDTTVTVTIDKTDMVGKLGEDTILFEGILKELVGASMDLKFAKEGTDAAKPENFLPEEEKAILGDWVGMSVADALGKDVSGEISPDSLQATLNADHTATISYKGEVIGTPKWSYFGGTVMFDGDIAGGASIYSSYSDGVFSITYSGDEYYEFKMESAGGANQ